MAIGDGAGNDMVAPFMHRLSTAPDLSRFGRPTAAFREVTGLPFLVNTSFNGFREPVVSDPRDVVRVCSGAGLAVLTINQFVGPK